MVLEKKSIVLGIALVSFIPQSSGQEIGRALLKAAKRGDLPRVQYILKKSKHPHRVVNTHHIKTGITPLHCAAHRNDNTLAHLLVRYGAQMNAQDHDGQTPLHAAAFDGCRLLVIYLVDHGARSDIRDKQNKLPRDYALQQGYREVAHSMDRYTTLKAQIQFYHNNPRMLGKILAQSIEYGFCSLVKLLLDRPVTPTQRSLNLAYTKYKETHNPSHRRIYNSLLRAFNTTHSNHPDQSQQV